MGSRVKSIEVTSLSGEKHTCKTWREVLEKTGVSNANLNGKNLRHDEFTHRTHGGELYKFKINRNDPRAESES